MNFNGEKKTRIPLVGGAYDTRILPERSRLEFHYNSGEATKRMIVFVPFFENPSIKEKKQANYVTYDVVGRSSSLYAYTGAKSRKFSLKANYTLPHLARFEMGLDKYRRLIDADSPEAQRSLFTNKKITGSTTTVGDVPYGPAQAYKEHYYETLSTIFDGASLDEVQNLIADAGPLNPIGLMGLANFAVKTQAINDSEAGQTYAGGISEDWTENAWETLKAVDTLLFFVNIFRTSVMNNASHPTHGPPIIRIVHGTLFQSVPCVCRSYTLEWEEKMGYELETLTPRRLVLTMQLEELRAGDFDNHGYGMPVKRDNLTGWESVITSYGHSHCSIDPGEIWSLG